MYLDKSDYLFDSVEVGLHRIHCLSPQQKCLNVNICTVNNYFLFQLFCYLICFINKRAKEKNCPASQKNWALFFSFSCQRYFNAIVLYCPLSDLFCRFSSSIVNVPKTKVVFHQLSEADPNKVNWHFLHVFYPKLCFSVPYGRVIW